MISLFFTAAVCAIAAADNLVLEPDTRVIRNKVGDDFRIEWQILNESYKSYDKEVFLRLSRNNTLLYHLHINNSFLANYTDLNTNNYRVNFSNRKVKQYGFVIENIIVSDASVYSCEAVLPGDGTVLARSDITLFIYAPPATPVIRADGPIMSGRDVILSCVTSSASEPSDLRPEMLITWYQDGVEVMAESNNRYTDLEIIDGRRLKLTSISASKITKYTCRVQEDGSSLVGESKVFPIMIRVLDSTTGPITNALPGKDEKLVWHLFPQSDPLPDYNRTVVFTRDRRQIAEYNIRYFHWYSLIDRLNYYSHMAGEHGITITNLHLDDAGYYACVYKDEFGTVIESVSIPLSFQGSTLPPPVTPDSTHISSEEPTPIGSSSIGSEGTPGASSGINKAALGGLVVLGLTLVAAILLTLILVKRRQQRKRKQHDALSAVIRREHQVDDVRYRTSIHSVYSTINESLMVPDDALIDSPQLPPRDDTYNQPFEESRLLDDTSRKTAMTEIDDSYLTPIGLRNSLTNSYYNRQPDGKPTPLSSSRHQHGVSSCDQNDDALRHVSNGASCDQNTTSLRDQDGAMSCDLDNIAPDLKSQKSCDQESAKSVDAMTRSQLAEQNIYLPATEQNLRNELKECKKS